MPLRDYWPTKNWRTAEPDTVAMNADLLEDAHQEILQRHRRIHGMLVVRHGYLVAERYYGSYSADHAHPLRSVTKSVLSALIGIAIDQGHIENIGQRVVDFFPDYTLGERHAIKRMLTLRHLLTMTSGFHSSGRRASQPLMARIQRTDDWLRFILDLPITPSQIGRFNYSDLNSQLLSAILTRATGMNTADYANYHLTDPLGMQPIASLPFEGGRKSPGPYDTAWLSDPQSHSIGGSGLSMTARDLARFGYLFLNEGRWEEKQIISPEWITASTTDHIKLDDPGAYGFHWWVNRIGGHAIYHALGYGGQFVVVAPELDMVVVIVADDSTLPSQGRDPMTLTERYIFPAVEGG